MSAPPFFIVGCGRSGTSLLREMLNSHSKLAVPLESLFIIDYLRAGSRMPLPEMLGLLFREPFQPPREMQDRKNYSDLLCT